MVWSQIKLMLVGLHLNYAMIAIDLKLAKLSMCVNPKPKGSQMHYIHYNISSG